MKKVMLFSMWLAASAAAVGVAWAGVSVVDNQVVGPPSVVEFASPTTTVGAQSSVPATSGSQPTTAPENETSSSTTAGDQAPSSTPTSAAQSNTSPTTQTTAQATTTPTSSSTTASVPTTLNTPPTSPGSTGPASTTQTFTLIGGTAAISFSPSQVEVLWATPNPGFEVSIEHESSGIEVEFRADHHRSRLDAWWAGGPQHDTREEVDD